ncbi:MAG: DUF3857 domain-containing protein [Burkholderiales bacterium]|nr:DUF3857 domain-containing protein [Burkholderiales bacterium]
MTLATTIRAHGLRCCLVAAAWPLAAGAQPAGGDMHPRAKSAPRTASAAAPGQATFTIERTPAWVQPLAADPAVPVPAGPYQLVVAEEQVRVLDHGAEHYRHTIRQINDTSALQQGGLIDLSFDPKYQRLVFHQVDIVRGSQRIDKLDPKKIHLLQREQQLERQVIDGRFTASLVLDDLRAGDRVEWSATVIGDNPVFGGRFVDTEWNAYGNAPIGTWRLRVVAPAARDIHVRVGDPATTTVTTRVHDGLRETQFKRTAIAQLAADDRLPPAEYLKWQVELSEFADWKEVADWAARLFARAMQSSPAVDAQVAELKAKSHDRESLLRATLDFVQRDIRYFGTEGGTDSHQPAAADTVLRQRFGDCKDKVALLAELLTRMGFEATPVIVSAQYQDASARRLPGPLAFDHAIVRVMVDGKPVFLDATRAYQTGRVQSREALDLGVGLLAQAGTTALAALPSGRDTVRVDTLDTFAFPKLAREGTLTSVTTLHGEWAESFRAVLASQSRADVEKAVDAEIIRAYPTLVATTPMEVADDSDDDAVRITAHYRTGEFWTLPEQRALLGRYAMGALARPLRLPDQPTRTQSLRSQTGRFLQRVVFDFGEPFPGVQNMPRFDEVNDLFELHTHGEAQSPRQEMSGELHLLTDTIPASEWTAHRDRVIRIWPRLGGNVVVSPYSVSQFAALRTEGDALLVKLRKGDLHLATQVQAAATMKLLALDKALDSDRLTPPLRAQVLVAKGVALDNLGKQDLGRGAIESALMLDPASAEAHAVLAENALGRGDDAMVLRETAETLKLSPSRTDIYLTRGRMHYLAGAMGPARDDFITALQSRQEVERMYGTIWLFLANRRAGSDAAKAADALHAFEPSATYPEWPYSVLQLMENRGTLDAAVAASQENGQRSASRECELYYYAGEKALADGDLAGARKFLRMSVATGVTEFIEYQAAQRELARIGDK